MSLSAFSDSFAAYDVTPVENLFLLEYMPHAPGDYVRVYLYGLMLCHHPSRDASVERMAHVLTLSPQDVMSAFRYWEQKGLVIRVADNPPQFQYQNVRSAMTAAPGTGNQDVYQHRDVLSRLGSILGDLERRHLTAIMEWIEDLKLPPEVILLIVQEKKNQLTEGGTKKRSLQYLFKAFEGCALDFAARGINTPEAAERELSRGSAEYKLASKVLDYYNFRRQPTQAELDLARKWLGEWHLGDKAITAALGQTAGSANPSFAYLDRILERHVGAQSGTVEASIERDKQLHDLSRELMNELGAGGQPTGDQRKQIEAWLAEGFEPGVLVRAAIRCNRSGRRSFDQLDLELRRWAELGILTVDKAEAHNQKQAELRKLAAEVFSRAGLNRRPTDADMNQIKEWQGTSSEALILFAADCANGLKLPMRAMAKNLGDWALSGIADVDAARATRKKPQQHKQQQPQKPESQGYAQRSYSSEFFDDFFAKLDEDGESK